MSNDTSRLSRVAATDDTGASESAVDSDSTQTEGTKQCSKCGNDYSPYLILIMDNHSAIVGYHSVKEEYKNICKDCYRDEEPSGKYAFQDR